MTRIAHLRPSATMLVAVVAIVLATAGSATAVGMITGRQIANNTITSADVRDGACRLFSTVLSPGYNAAHADHLHLDQAERGKFGGRLCR